MAKIMLVEDDNNLREIYEARLLAEGYEIVSAEDGEQALALAVKEKPDLIISDVMMPKISGFDMLDILRSTPETRDTKVIMMTALSQAEDKTRADKLGADRYLVKSQVTLEDVAKVAKEVLSGEAGSPGGGPAPDPIAPIAPITPTDPASPVDPPTPITPAVPPDDPAAAQTAQDGGTPDPKVSPELSSAPATPTSTQASTPAPSFQPAVAPAPVASVSTRPVQSGPVSVARHIDSSRPMATPPAMPVAQEEATVASQVNQFANSLPGQQAPLPPPPPMEMVEAPNAAPDLTNAAADNAAKMAHAANELLGKVSAPAAPDPAAQPEPALATVRPGNQISGKKVLMPINDVSAEANTTSLNDLLQKEAQNNGVEPPPTTSVVSPSGETVTPAAPTQAPNDKAPGNVIQPDPNSIAL